MNVMQGPQERMIWAFWGAAALAAVGGLMPIVFAGTSGRLAGVIIPYWIAAIGFGACALIYRQGRIPVAVIYFFAGMAIVFGLLAMFSLPMRLAVLGTCPAPPAPCASGLPRPLTDAENTGMGVAAVMGILSVFVGFLGLSVLYRRSPAPPSVPTRRIPPMPPRPSAPEPAAPAPVPAQPVDEKPVAQDEPEELPAHEEDEVPELPAEEEVPELPAHEPTPPST
ncbi:MAG TPA: hypothetical protein VEU76_07415 [Candidatus Udaeobacter sp.]|nr:hypothetical protein [Candidatus Udaeobacter sp.]